MTPPTAVVYYRPGCPGCGALIRWLDDHGVAWLTRDVLADSSAAQRVTRLGYRSLPVVETADSRSAWGGDLDAVAALFSRRPAAPEAPSAADPEPAASHG
jgi:glutaredoxin-like protein NrdH